MAVSSAKKDAPHVSAEWEFARDDPIDGVLLREIKNVVTHNGVTTEVYREDWGVTVNGPQQILHVDLRPAALSAWHMHRGRYDHLLVVSGHIKVVLHDGREDSPSQGRTEVFVLSPMRPTLVVIPPAVWHGVQNLDSAGHSSFINFFDKQYDYEDPDEWRLPPDTEEIPYRF
jgi:dTDP-4-dehydrorhamnose 3,5-epimerase